MTPSNVISKEAVYNEKMKSLDSLYRRNLQMAYDTRHHPAHDALSRFANAAKLELIKAFHPQPVLNIPTPDELISMRDLLTGLCENLAKALYNRPYSGSQLKQQLEAMNAWQIKIHEPNITAFVMFEYQPLMAELTKQGIFDVEPKPEPSPDMKKIAKELHTAVAEIDSNLRSIQYAWENNEEAMKRKQHWQINKDLFDKEVRETAKILKTTYDLASDWQINNSDMMGIMYIKKDLMILLHRETNPSSDRSNIELSKKRSAACTALQYAIEKANDTPGFWEWTQSQAYHKAAHHTKA